MTTREIGQAAEAAAAMWLESEHGYVVMARNWRTRWCELDVIARDLDGRIRFIEVKYRRDLRYGNGLEYISHDKSRRLLRAAQSWCMLNRYDGDYQIDIVAVTGTETRYRFELVENALDG